MQIPIHIYIRISLGGCILGTFYARKLKFGLQLTQTVTFNSVVELLLGHAIGWG